MSGRDISIFLSCTQISWATKIVSKTRWKLGRGNKSISRGYEKISPRQRAVNDITVGSKPADGGHHKNISRPGFSGFPIVSSLYRDHNSSNFCSFKSTIHLITCPFLLFSWNLYFNNVSFLGCILHFPVFFFLFQNLSRLSKEVIFCCFAKAWQLFRRLKMSRRKIL